MSTAPQPPRYEPQDAHPRVLGGLGAALALLVALGLGAAAVFLRADRPAAEGAPEATAFPAGARYQTSVEASWTAYERDTRAHLDGYGWVDRSAGVVRVPIERAIDLITAPPRTGPAAGREGGGP